MRMNWQYCTPVKWVINVATSYIPDRRHIVWLDFEPAKGKEIGKYRPALILSSKTYNKASGLVICCPISTSIRGAQTEVPLPSTVLEQPSVVAANLIQTLSWQERKIKYLAEIDTQTLVEVLYRIIPLIGGEHLFAP